MRPRLIKRDERGFTLIEVLVASTLLLVGVLGTVSLAVGADVITGRNKAREAATALNRQITEGARAIPYPELTPGSVVPKLQALPDLGDSGAGAGWTLVRRGVVYTVSASACSLDDPKDGTGTHDGATFCADSAAAGTSDQNPEDYKRVTVTVSWSGSDGKKALTQKTIIDNPGAAVGPAIRTLTRTSPALTGVQGSICCGDAANGAGFQLTTSVKPTTVAWYLNGAFRGYATDSGNGTTWNFTWSLPPQSSNPTVLDGAYQVSAEGFDQYGASGPARQLTVIVNRYAPSTPRGFVAGYTNGGTDMEWLPNTEPDVIGYRVYRRIDTGASTLVCPAAPDVTWVKDSFCRDVAGVPDPATANVQYTLVAVDRDTDNNAREGSGVTGQLAVPGPPPGPPTSFAATTSSGVVRLTWATPSTGAPAFYRIYRDGTLYANRYDRTGLGTDTSWQDTTAAGTGHSYWISAVDASLGESAIVGPKP